MSLRAAGIALALVPLAAANGGYFPTSWGWAILAFGWVVAVALVLGRRIEIPRTAVLLVAALAAYSAWIWLSALWSRDVPASIFEGERSLVYVVAALALVLVAARTEALVLGVLAASTLVTLYALGTRLFPNRLGTFDSFGGYRLNAPVGYWNSLGLLAAIGIVVALGIAARADGIAARALAGASLVPLAATLYFTFSRGAWVALAVALVFLVALDPRRLQAVAAALPLAAPPALAVALASRQHALTTLGAPLARATSEGHRLAVELVLLALLGAALATGFALGERRAPVPRAARTAFAAALAAAVLAGVGAVWAVWGSPPTLVQRGWHGFVSPPVASAPDLNSRLFHLSGTNRILTWRAALRQFHLSPATGTGAGTFETWWLQHRPVASQVRDAHSLYLETLGELGVVGLVLLALFLTAPLAGAWSTRRAPLVPYAAAAFVVWAVHAAVDWDWELVGVTLPAFACALACSETPTRWELKPAGRYALGGLALATLAAGLVATIGNHALAASRSALNEGNVAAAATQARRAERWAPWSAEPWLIRGAIEAASGERAAARASYRRAIDREPRSYLAWYGLASVDTGTARKRDLAKVVRLNPFSDEAADSRRP